MAEQAMQAVLAEIGRLTAAAEALAAVGARLRLPADGGDADPAVVESLDRVVDLLFPGGEIAELAAPQRHVVLGAARAFFAQAKDLLDDPARPCGWSEHDPDLLLSQGQLSAIIASLIQASVDEMTGLDERLGRPGAEVLDVGCGVGALAVAACRTWPAVSVVGVDPWAPSLALARAAVAEARLRDRIELRAACIEQLEDRDRFDLAWVPGPFLSADVLPVALDAVAAALRPGGWAVLGLYGAPDGSLAEELAVLRALRSGGQRLTTAQAVDRLHRCGLVDVAVLPRPWSAPVLLVAGQRPAGPPR